MVCAGSSRFAIPSGSCSKFRVSIDKRYFSRCEYHSFNDWLRLHDERTIFLEAEP
jgi:hypothetical protein